MLQTFKPCGMGRVLPARQPISTGTIAARRVRCNGSVPPASTAAATTAPAAPAPVAQAVAAMDAAADSTALYTPPPMDARMYQQLMMLQQQQLQQQQQPGAYRQQDYHQQYQGMPPAAQYYPPAPPASYKAEEAGNGVPWFIFVGVGILAAQVLAKVQDYMKNPKTPQQMMQEMMMKQMQASMGGAAGAPSPFPGGAPGASPFTMPSGFGGPNSPFGMPPKGFPSAPSAATVDTTAWSMPTPQQTPPPPQQQQSNGYPSSSQSAPAQKFDVVNPVVKEPSSTSSNRSSEAPKKAFFTDASDTSSSSATGSSNGASTPSMPPFQFPSTPGNGTTPTTEEASVMGNMMENMLRNPEMQKMIYPYLPEPMRNPASVEWMLGQPEVKKQMETLFAQQSGSMSPEMMGMMKGMDYNQDKVNKQFEELGLKPEDVIGKVMANPELAAGFQNPKVQAAIIDISANPMNVVKYQNDPEIMKVLEKVTEIFQPNVPPGQRQ